MADRLLASWRSLGFSSFAVTPAALRLWFCVSGSQKPHGGVRMRRFRLLSAFLLTFFWTSIQATAASVDPNTLLAQAIVAVTGGKSVSDVTLSGAAVWMLGSDQESGTGTL